MGLAGLLGSFGNAFSDIDGEMIGKLLAAGQPTTDPNQRGFADIASALSAKPANNLLSQPATAPLGANNIDMVSQLLQAGRPTTEPNQNGFGQISNIINNRLQPSAPANTNVKGPLSINSLKEAAMRTYPDSPILQQVALSQAILESGAPGKMSKLATENNNLFGIKSGGAAPGTSGEASLPTKEYFNGVPQTLSQRFAANNSIDDSFMQHRALLSKLQRYAPVREAQTPEEAFSALQKGGYATDPNYSKKLSNIYKTYVLPAYQNF